MTRDFEAQTKTCESEYASSPSSKPMGFEREFADRVAGMAGMDGMKAGSFRLLAGAFLRSQASAATTDDLRDALVRCGAFGTDVKAATAKLGSVQDAMLLAAAQEFKILFDDACKRRTTIKNMFTSPDRLETCLGVLIVAILFLYGWIDMGTSNAFVKAMNPMSDPDATAMTLTDVALASFAMVGAVQVSYAMLVSLVKASAVGAGMVFILFFVESFVVRAVAMPLHEDFASEKEGVSNASKGDQQAMMMMNLENSIAPSMRSLRVVLALFLDSRILLALMAAFFVSLIFACLVIAFVAISRNNEEATKESDIRSARLAGRVTSAFMLASFIAFATFAILGKATE